MEKRGPLSQAEQRQREEAAQISAQRRRRHLAETTPSVRQGSSGAPTRAAVGLFRQGQQRPDTRAARGVWDTRSTEPAIGAINATVRFHFPEAYRSKTPDAAIASSSARPPLAMALSDAATPRNRRSRRGRGKFEPTHRELTIANPEDMIEALRHPEMRAIVEHTVGIVRDHQKATIEKGYQRKLIPEGTRPGTVTRAYKHAALRAMHKAGLIDYDTKMDEAAKREFRPLNRFMFYAHRRVFDHLNQPPLQGKWDAFRQEFGQLYVQRKYGLETGHRRMRMRPVHEFVKLELPDGDLVKAWEDARPEAKRARRRHHHVPELPHGPPPIAGAHVHLRDAARAVEAHFGCPPIGGMTRKQADGTFLVLQKSAPWKYVLAGAAGGVAGAGLGSRLAERRKKPTSSTGAAMGGEIGATAGETIGALRGGPLGGAAGGVVGGTIGSFLGGRFGSRKRKLAKGTSLFSPSNEVAKSYAPLSKLLGDPLLGDYNTDPARQLRRAIHPRIRQRKVRIRFGSRGLRRALSGGITHQERWLLGATTRSPSSLGKADTTLEALGWRKGREVDFHTHIDHPGHKLVQNVDTIVHTHGMFPAKVVGTFATPAEAHASVTRFVARAARGILRKRLFTEAEVRAAAREASPNPTDAQKEAGNYRKGHVRICGLDIAIENRKGSWRRGKSKNGKRWASRCPAHYGYIKGAEGADGDKLDVYLGPHAHEADQHPAFIVEQHHPHNGAFDEHKTLVGFRDQDQALATYDRGFSDGSGPKRRKTVHQVTFDEFREWVDSGKTHQPLKKGIIGAAANWGARVFPKIAGAAAARVSQTGAARAASRFAARPRVARAVNEAKTQSWTGLLAPGRFLGRVGGAMINHPKAMGALGGAGLALDYTPQAYTAAHLAGWGSRPDNRSSRQGSKPAFQLPKATPLAAGKKQMPTSLRKAAIGPLLSRITRPPGFIRPALGRVVRSRPFKLGLVAGAGAAAEHARREWDQSPTTRAVVGGLLPALAVAAATRGRARLAVIRSTRKGLTQALAGATTRSARQAAVTSAKAARRAGLARVHASRTAIAVTGGLGAGAGLLAVRRHRASDFDYPVTGGPP